MFPTEAQRGRVEVLGDVGATGFISDVRDQHLLVGDSLRAHFTQRLSFQPEYLFLNGRSHSDSVLLANVADDFRPPSRRVVPHFLVGAGVVQRNPRWFVAADFRVEFKPHYRFSVGIGYVLRP